MVLKHLAEEESLVKEEKKKNNIFFSILKFNNSFFFKKNCKFPTLKVWLEFCNLYYNVKKLVSIVLCLFILNSGFKMDATIDTNAKIKAVFIYNFTKYIEWPQSYKEGEFTIGIVGETPLYSELIKMTETKKVANQTLEVKKFNSPSEVTKCHILYICKDKSSNISDIIKKLKNNSTLLVTEENGLMEKGAGINFIIKDNRQKFELNKGNVEKYKLKISSNLEALAFTVK